MADPENDQNTSGDNTEGGDADYSEVTGSDITAPGNSNISNEKTNTGVYSIAVPIMLLGAATTVVTIRKKNS